LPAALRNSVGSGHSSRARKDDWFVLGFGPALSHCWAAAGLVDRTDKANRADKADKADRFLDI
jgi:hypothetical protein